jgi:hypothetical protein
MKALQQMDVNQYDNLNKTQSNETVKITENDIYKWEYSIPSPPGNLDENLVVNVTDPDVKIGPIPEGI